MMDSSATPCRLACLGDSHTRGNFGYCWLADLETDLGPAGFRFGNFGVNGEVVYQALARLPEVEAFSPDKAMLLMGTNDVNAVVNRPVTQRYVNRGRLPQVPDRDFFRDNYRRVVERLLQVAPGGVALVSLPLLGEKLDGEANRLVDAYNDDIRSFASQMGCVLLDLNAEMRRLLLELRPSGPYRDLYQGRGLMKRAMFRRYLLRQDWDKIGQGYGMSLLTDSIHLNATSGRALAGLVKSWLLEA